ncbi:uncharacterized protein AC631_04512 [Debaryomyces fabryi]|uniref:Methionine--tRNA ligase, mitochondrial n=1 Tax=Debaryomyces fabryi TaxID=58627 RepID=A0A0V1PU91_9ASCO|nr:uncharacterized protein AC631_04512 [Debaryomyces fabryi]KRZ99745.1 hypothetical protein AC631_04512 [Debaryomyces fabryi]CUM54412.1 unnamed protein product [Debaryomyces fabryi]
MSPRFVKPLRMLMAKRLNSTTVKPFYITSPIFYVNARPHLGHLYSMLLCDTRNRWEKLDPNKLSYFLTGTDEHGLKIQAAAEKLGIPPKELTDQVSTNFKNLGQRVNIEYDRFIRTTDEDHVKTVQYFWKVMQEKGFLYEGSHSGWYAISDETFYPETQIEEIVDSNTGKKKMISKETKNEVIYQEETNYFFKLSHFQDKLISFLESNPDFIKPKSKYTELLRELKEYKLTDLSVSRPSSRLTWGIEVPDDSSQKIYVWFDALLNYLTACGFPEKFPIVNEKYQTEIGNMWPATHIIGKDIIRFHCIYWPIFLMAAGIELPRQVVVHSHWLCDGFKMSKSLGNVVDPLDTLEYYGEDALRFFLTEYSNIDSDCNYSEQHFYLTRENLIGKYANLITRCGGNAFNILDSINSFKEGKFDNIDALIADHCLNNDRTIESKQIIALKNELSDTLNHLYESMDLSMSSFDHMRAIQKWWIPLEKANQLFQLGQPWLYTKSIKSDTVSDGDKEIYKTIQNYYVFMAAETSRICSVLINPIIPKLSSKILDRLAVSPTNRTLHFTSIGSDLTYGEDANSKKHKIPIQRIPIRSLD